jgi:hypothetical protein
MKALMIDKVLHSVIRLFSERLPNPEFEAYYTEMLEANASSAPSAEDARQDYEAMLHAQLTGFSSGH